MALFIKNKEQCLSLLQQLQIDSFDLLASDLLASMKLAENAESLGKDKKGTQYWDVANDLLYVNTYLMIIKNRILSDVSHGVFKTYQEYSDEFALDCIVKTFACNGIDIRPLYGVYGLLLETYYTDGIEYMVIEPNPSETPFDVD